MQGAAPLLWKGRINMNMQRVRDHNSASTLKKKQFWTFSLVTPEIYWILLEAQEPLHKHTSYLSSPSFNAPFIQPFIHLPSMRCLESSFYLVHSGHRICHGDSAHHFGIESVWHLRLISLTPIRLTFQEPTCQITRVPSTLVRLSIGYLCLCLVSLSHIHALITLSPSYFPSLHFFFTPFSPQFWPMFFSAGSVVSFLWLSASSLYE